ncbi:uncharacterized protein TNCV_1389891 [Trichonephila clavipes]|nr:uncharacterized protein TNCV_1389891 [Trichonephila clavipes]
MKRADVEENSSSTDNLLMVSVDVTWKTRGHSSLIGLCTVIGAETVKVLDREVLSSFCKGYDSYKGVKYGDGDTKTFNALSENKPYGDYHLIRKIECVGHVQKRMSTRLKKLKLVYGKKKLSDGKTIGGKERFGLKINRHVCVSLAELDNRRIFASRQKRLASSFEARRAKKIKKTKEIELFQEQKEPKEVVFPYTFEYARYTLIFPHEHRMDSRSSETYARENKGAHSRAHLMHVRE